MGWSARSFGVIEMNRAEIAQVIHLTERHHALDSKIDRRVVRSKEVQRWAVNCGLAIWECQHGRLYDGWSIPPWSHVYLDDNSTETPARCNWKLRFRRLADVGTRYLQFNAEWDLPPEALWHFISQFLYFENGQTRGYSINKHPGWLTLDIYHEGHAWDKENRDLERRITALDRLVQAGYIIFQTAGSVWRITPTEAIS